MSGCPNSCGQPQIADIGMQGCVVKTENGPKDAFMIALGGTLEGDGAFNHRNKLKGRVIAENLGAVLVELIRFYKEERRQGESFHDFFNRIGIQPFQERFNAAVEKIEGAAAAS
jgi:ferredoxin-nitrite reductase